MYLDSSDICDISDNILQDYNIRKYKQFVKSNNYNYNY